MTEAAALADLRRIVAPDAGRACRVGPTGSRLLPVAPGLAPLLPEGGLRRGSTVVVSGSTSLLLSVLSVPSQAGAWCAMVGFASLGVLATAEAGIVLERLVLVPEAGPRWQTVTAAFLDGLDVVVIRPPDRMHGSDARQLTARARERGVLLVAAGEWEGADIRLSAADLRWEGLEQGYGRLRAARVRVGVRGRGAADRPSQGHLTLPELEPVTAVPVTVPLRGMPGKRPPSEGAA